MPALTPEQIARLRAEGKTVRQIATELGVSITTICRWKDPVYRERHNASQRRSRLRNREPVEARRSRWLERSAPRCSHCGRPLTRATASRQPVVCGACFSERVAERQRRIRQLPRPAAGADQPSERIGTTKQESARETAGGCSSKVGSIARACAAGAGSRSVRFPAFVCPPKRVCDRTRDGDVLDSQLDSKRRKLRATRARRRRKAASKPGD